MLESRRYSRFAERLKENMLEQGLDRRDTVLADWNRIGGGDGVAIVDKNGEKSLHTFNKEIDGVESHYFNTHAHDVGIGELKKIWGEILCDNEETLAFLSKYSSQNGFLHTLGSFVSGYFSQMGLSPELDYTNSFECEDEKIIMHSTVIVTNARLLSNGVIPLSFTQPIKIETSVDILKGENISDKKRLVNPQILYFGYKGGEKQEKLKTQVPTTDSAVGSEDNIGSKESLDSGLGSGNSSETSSQSGDDQEGKTTIDGSVLFYDDFEPIQDEHTTAQDMADAVECFKGLEKSSENSPIYVIYYNDWKNGKKEQNLYAYIQEKKEEFQHYIQQITTHARQTIDKEIQKKTFAAGNVKSLINEDGADRVASFNSGWNGVSVTEQIIKAAPVNDDNTAKVLGLVVQYIKENGGLQNIVDSDKRKLQELQRLRLNNLLSVGACSTVFLLSSTVCVVNALGQVGVIGSNVLSIGQNFHNPAEVAILSSVGIIALLALVVTAAVSVRVAERSNEISEAKATMPLNSSIALLASEIQKQEQNFGKN